jgi:hypothetical protein
MGLLLKMVQNTKSLVMRILNLLIHCAEAGAATTALLA